MEQISFVIKEVSKFPSFTKELACGWLGIVNPNLGDKMPIDLIKDGRFNEVKNFIDKIKLEDGII